MRTTLTLDPDVADKIRDATRQMRQSAKTVINAALRIGLERLREEPKNKPYSTRPRPMGLRAGLAYDNIADLLASAESEDFK
jgi:hypothetical protein